MKKLLYLLMFLPLGLFVSSCDDDDKVPEVDVSATISGGVISDDVIYVLKGETLTFESLELVNHTGKKGVLGEVQYFIDGFSVGIAYAAPYTFVIDTEQLAVGNHVVTADAPIYVVDYSPCWGVFNFKMKVVADEDELPGEPADVRLGAVIRQQ